MCVWLKNLEAERFQKIEYSFKIRKGSAQKITWIPTGSCFSRRFHLLPSALRLVGAPPPSTSPPDPSMPPAAIPIRLSPNAAPSVALSIGSARRLEHRLRPLPRAPAPPDAAPSSSRRRSSAAHLAIAPLEAPPPHALVLPHRRTGAPLPIRLCAPLLGATCCGRALRLLTCRTTWNGMPALPFLSMPPAR
jgi:hypothetical protein